MFSRRPNERHNRGRVPTAIVAVAPTTPLTIMAAGGGGVLIWLRSDFVTTSGGGLVVDSMNDQSGNGHHFTGVNSPAYETGSLDGHAAVYLNGTNTTGPYLRNTTHVLPAPGTTPTWHWFILTLVAWNASEAVINSDAGGTFHQEIFCNTATPQIRSFNGASTPLNNGLTLGTPERLEALFSNQASDYVRAGSVEVTGNAGNSGGTGNGTRIGADSAATLRTELRLYEYVRMNRAPSAGERSAMVTYAQARYPTITGY